MNQVLIYVLMGVIIFLILFLTIRFILQMVFIRECPNCGRSVSLAVGRECPGCGFVFLKNRQAKLNLAIVLLILGIGVFIYLDVHSFRKETASYLASNPYLWRGETVASTEIGVEQEELAGSLPEEPQGEQQTSSNPIAGVFQDILDGLSD